MLALGLFVGFAALSPPSVVSIAPPTGLELKLVDDAKDGKLDTMTLLQAALVASGVADADVPAEERRLKLALEPAIERARTQKDAHRRGDVLLRALHETVFRAYSFNASEIDDVGRTGDYNCLSSALLYVVAADGLLDHPEGMVTKHHAFARVTVNGQPVDVETTTKTGFDADRNKLMTPEYVKKIAGTDASPQELLDDLKHPEELPVLSLVAGLYSNRAVGLAARGDLQGAAVALDRASKLASGALRARSAAWRGSILNNGAVQLLQQGRVDDARALLELALEGTDGDTKILTNNLATVQLKLADDALTAKDFTGALTHADAAHNLGATDAERSDIRARAESALAALEGNDSRCKKIAAPAESGTCYAGLARSVIDSDVNRALQYARRGYGLAPAEKGTESALFVTLAKKARRETDAAHCDAVEALVREALAHVVDDNGRKWNSEEVVGVCWAHAGDAAFDKKDWANASRLYERARVHLPKSDAIRSNVASVDMNRAIELGQSGDCDPARALAHRAALAEPALADKATSLLESCAGIRAEKDFKKKDWGAALGELRRGLLDAPTSKGLADGVGTALHNLAVKALADKDCDSARALLPELVAAKRDTARDAVLQQCP